MISIGVPDWVQVKKICYRLVIGVSMNIFLVFLFFKYVFFCFVFKIVTRLNASEFNQMYEILG